MNAILSFIAWSPVLVTMAFYLFLLVYVKILFTHPFITSILAFLIVWWHWLVWFKLPGILKRAAGCKEMNEGTTSGCTLFGRDVSQGLYTFMVAPWFGMFTFFPVLLLGIGVGIWAIFWAILQRVIPFADWIDLSSIPWWYFVAGVPILFFGMAILKGICQGIYQGVTKEFMKGYREASAKRRGLTKDPSKDSEGAQ